MADSPKRREPNAPIEIQNQKDCQAVHLPRNGAPSIVQNSWHWLSQHESNHLIADSTPSNTAIESQKTMVSYGWWHDCRDANIIQTLSDKRVLALGFLPDDRILDEAHLIREWMEAYPEHPFGIYFPTFKDGRGYSIASTLRERFNYQGQIIAFGDILVDQLNYLARVGFDTMVLREDQSLETAVQRLSTFSVNFQNDWRKRRSTTNQTADTSNTHANQWAIPMPIWDSIIAEKHQQLKERIQNILKAHPQIVLSHSLSAEDTVLTHLLTQEGHSNPSATIRYITLDTKRLPKESYQAMEEIEAHFSLSLERIKPDQESVQTYVEEFGLDGFYDNESAKKRCCHVRKVEPLQAAISDEKACITGQRQDQSVTRTLLQLEEAQDDNTPIKFNPLFDWTEAEVWAVIHRYHLPIHPLYWHGYASIGCAPCTRSVKAGEDIRAGRWWWISADKKECGLHESVPS